MWELDVAIIAINDTSTMQLTLVGLSSRNDVSYHLAFLQRRLREGVFVHRRELIYV
jgi:hypothetical protein